MLRVTYRMNRWPPGKTSVWLAQSREWLEYVMLTQPSVIILLVEV